MAEKKTFNAPPPSSVKTERSDLFYYVASEVERIGRPCILCLQDPFDDHEIEAVLDLSWVVGIILQSKNPKLLAAFPDRFGYYTETQQNWVLPPNQNWVLPPNIAADMIYIGPWAEFGVRLSLRAWRAGIKFIHPSTEFNIGGGLRIAVVVFRKLSTSLLSLLRAWLLKPMLRRRGGYFFRFQELLFNLQLKRLERFSLPMVSIPRGWQRGRIVVVAGTLGPGGAERQIVETLLGLHARGYFDLHLLHHAPMRPPSDFFLPPLLEAGISYSQPRYFFRQFSLPQKQELARCLAPLGNLRSDVASYANEFIAREPEIVHAWLDHTNVVVGLAALLVGVPRIVLSCRSFSPMHFAFCQPEMRPIYRLLASFPHVTFLNNSAAGARDYEQWLGISSFKTAIVLQNGFDFSTFPLSGDRAALRCTYRHRFGIPEGVPVVGTVMRFSEEKRPLLWVEIARQVGGQIPDAHFLVIGSGPMSDEVKAAGEKLLPGRIHFPGNTQDVPMSMTAMDIFLLTSRLEGLPNVLIEAQAAGVPPVAFDVGGVKETMIAGETGWLMSSDIAEIAADEIVGILSDKARIAKASEQAIAHAYTRFNLDRMIDETLAVYQMGQ